MDSFEALRILGVRPGASAQVIRQAYLSEARKSHPDSGTSPDATRMAQLNVAYEYLSKQNTSGDSIGWEDSEPPEPPPGPSPQTPPQAPPQWAHGYQFQEVKPSILARVWSNGFGRLAVIAAVLFGLSGLVEALSTDDEDRISAQNQAATRPVATVTSASSVGATRSVFDLRVGDCIATTGEGALSTVRVVQCSSSLAELRVSRLIALPNSTTVPSRATLSTFADRCPLGWVTTLTPTVESWAAGDRTLTCLSRP